jgi:hypothetical protein
VRNRNLVLALGEDDNLEVLLTEENILRAERLACLLAGYTLGYVLRFYSSE